MQGARAQSVRWRERGAWSDCNFFKYKGSAQQLQQMSLPDEESGVAIFYRLRGLFFDDNQEEDHIVNIIRQEPIKTIGTVLLLLTKSYNQKLNDIVEPLEEEKYLLLERLRETREQLQHSMDDNQFFKSTIDKLQEQKKETEEKLNESIDHFQRSREDILHEIDEREKIKSEVLKIYSHAEEICSENSQLKMSIAEYEKELAGLRQEMEQVRADNEEMVDVNQEMRDRYDQAIRLQDKYCSDIQELQNRLHEREEFIASFIDQYNKVHLFNQESSARDYPQDKIEEENNELEGFNFNNFDRNSNISEKSLSKNSSLCNLDNEMDEKFQFVNATAEKVKPKIPISHACVTDEKPPRKAEGKLSSNKQKQLDSKKRNPSNKVEMKKVSSNNKVVKTLVKTVSSKNLKLKESMMITPSENDGSKMMEEMLKKKLAEKNQKIARLESEIKHLKEGFIEQRQKVTIMEGEYELEIEELKEQLTFTKKELSAIYEKYSIANAECAAYQERLEEMESELAAMEQEHKSYCEELKRRCKEYVLKKIDEVQQECKNIKGEMRNKSVERGSNTSQDNHNDSNDQLEYSIQSQQAIPDELHLNLKESQEQLIKIDSFSEIQSYQRISNHYLNGFELQLSSKMSNIEPNQEEIFVQEQFDIGSNLGGFTERLVSGKKEVKLLRERASLTDRCNLQNDFNPIKSEAEKKPLSLYCQVYELEVERIGKQLAYVNHLCEYMMVPRTRRLSFNNIESILFVPQDKCLNYATNIASFTFTPASPMMSLQNVFAYTYEPTMHLDIYLSIIQQSYIPRQKVLQIAYNTLYTCIQKRKESISVPFQFLHVEKKRDFQIIKAIELNVPSSKQLSSSFVQTETVRKQQSEAQTISDKSSTEAQTLLLETLECWTQMQKEACQSGSQWQPLFELLSTPTQTIVRNFIDIQSQTQRKEPSVQACQTEAKEGQQIHTQTVLQICHQQVQTQKQFKLSKKLTFGSQIISYQLQNTSPGSIIQSSQQEQLIPLQMLQSSTPHSFCPDKLFSTPTTSQYSNFPKQAKKEIHQRICYEISQQSFEHQSINNQESNYSQNVSQINLKVLEENLSTKNDEIVITRNELIAKNVNIVYEASQKKRRLADRRLSDFSDEISNSNNYSILNNAVLLSQDNDKKDGPTFNPESKSYRNQRMNQTQISISPWFVEERKEPQEKQASSSKMLPVEVSNQLKAEQTQNMEKYLNKHKLKLSYCDQIEKLSFKKPRDIKKKIYFVFGNKNGVREAFMISSTRIQNIRTSQYIKFQANNVIDHVNFFFGQSQVIITGDSYLILHRSGKKNKLQGTLQDGKWAIEFYITCTYQKMD